MDQNQNQDQNQNLTLMCRGNQPDRGWEELPNGKFIASVYDRRRIAVADMQMVAQAEPSNALEGPMIGQILRRHSVGPTDWNVMAANFNAWAAKNLP